MNKKIRIRKKIKTLRTRKTRKIIAKMAKAKVIIGIFILLIGIWIFYEITKPKAVAVTQWFSIPSNGTQQNIVLPLSDEYQKYNPKFMDKKKK